jgi:hypothetical protein
MWRIKHRAPNGALALLIPLIYKHLVPPGPGAMPEQHTITPLPLKKSLGGRPSGRLESLLVGLLSRLQVLDLTAQKLSYLV